MIVIFNSYEYEHKSPSISVLCSEFIVNQETLPFQIMLYNLSKVARMGEKRNVYRLLVGKPEGKRPLGRPRRRWKDNIKMDLLETGLSVVDCIGLAEDRYRWRSLVNSVMNLWVP
jgi:hypothetical protein